ncbi:uncharacterized protein LOC141903681 [Tubulanus polymorphus]|uniref:uncharacterized protein LOC141903681 n=1 Tax=Tubulanus polymorphus TaxID=672921 RepID=UPI003DA5CC71
MVICPDDWKTLRATFKAFDSDRSGILTVEKVKRVFENAGVKVAEDEIAKQLVLMDRNEDGKVDIEDYIQAMLDPE